MAHAFDDLVPDLLGGGLGGDPLGGFPAPSVHNKRDPADLLAGLTDPLGGPPPFISDPSPLAPAVESPDNELKELFDKVLEMLGNAIGGSASHGLAEEGSAGPLSPQEQAPDGGIGNDDDLATVLAPML